MWAVVKRNPLAAVIAVAMHIAIIAFMVVGVDWLEKPVQSRSGVEVVQARVIDQAKIDAEVKKLKQAEAKKRAVEEAARRKEEKRLADLKRKQAAEKSRLAELKKKRRAQEKAEARRRADAKKRSDAEKKRLAKLKKEKAALEKKRKLEEKRLAEAAARRKAEERQRKESEMKAKAEAEKKRLAALEKKRKAEEAKRKAEEAARLAAEQKAREDALQARMETERIAGERAQYVAAIRQKIERNWLRPSTVNKGLSCELRVRLIPGGGVAAVTITRSSGNGAFDRSVEQAVYKADPLDVPNGAGFEYFRDLKLVFDPSK